MLAVDDGSRVIAVHHIFRQAATATANIKQRFAVTQSRKGKERQLDQVTCGIPEEYLLPPPPPMMRRAGPKKSSTKAVNVSDQYKIGDLVSVRGRVDLWVDRKERIVLVDRVLQKYRDLELGRADLEGYIELVEDPNEESKHLLKALLLSATDYSAVFELQSASNVGKAPERTAQREEALRQYKKGTVARRELDETGRRMRVMEDAPEERLAAYQRQGLGTTHRLVSVNVSTAEESRKNSEEKRDEASRKKPKEAVKKSTGPSQNVQPSKQTSLAPTMGENESGRHRQLRSFTKLSDSKMTESTFRVYVEKHLLDYCSNGVTRGERGEVAGTSKGLRLWPPRETRCCFAF
ncbi:hypothetical protein CBS101457_005450 [Exobasidium rhododendri]|nr:hypothetical protein CBS101457_005450 [Exobasidium rhododendri]